MNKKIIILLLVFLQMPAFASSYLDKQLKEVKKNQKYGTVQKQTAKYSVPSASINKFVEIKDPKLIKLSDVPEVSERAYQLKLKEDEKIYNTVSKPAIDVKLTSFTTDSPVSVDFYNVYRIAERIIRANNLQYANWRIAIRKTEEDINAYSGSANFVMINTALYDSLYSNDDALALVIGHEMGHLLLGHSQRQAENQLRLTRLKEISSICRKGSVCDATVSASNLVKMKKIEAEMREMEFMADNYGAMLAYRAGFNLDNAMSVYNLLNTLEHVKTFRDTHPQPEKRIENALEARSVLPVEWVNEGKYNILNSKVLGVKKSSDRVSIVINSDVSVEQHLQTEDSIKLLTRFAYVNYRNGKMDDAIKYFKKLSELSNDYIPYLYLSYANEYLYRCTKANKYLNLSKKYLNEAKKINSSDGYVQRQAADLDAL